jgi:putative hydrolase of the HAD superfamily
MDSMKLRALVFDFGNVVGFFSHRRAAERLAAHAAVSADALHAALFSGRLEDDYESGRITTAEFLGQLRQSCGLTCADEAFAEAYADIFWPNPEVCGLLPQLRPRYRLFLGSNTTELHSRWFRRQFADVFGHFDALVLSHEVGARKPSAAFFEHCRRLAGCAPEECLFIDDLPANVAGAVACGWHGIVYTPEGALRRHLAELGVDVHHEGAA